MSLASILREFNRSAFVVLAATAPAIPAAIVSGTTINDLAKNSYEDTHTAPLSDYERGERDGEARILGGIAAGVGGTVTFTTVTAAGAMLTRRKTAQKPQRAP